MNCRMDDCKWPKGGVCPWPGDYCPKRGIMDATDRKMAEIAQILQPPCETCRSQCAKFPTQNISNCGAYKRWLADAIAWLRRFYGRDEGDRGTIDAVQGIDTGNQTAGGQINLSHS